MKLIFVRHGEPDYTIDSLTEKGRKEAELLSDRMERIDREEQIREIYVSPLGRAQETAAPSLKRLHRNAVTLDWLEEFPPRILRPDSSGERKITWDWLPEDWTVRSCFYDPDRWGEDPVMREAHVKERYDSVCSSFDHLLASHGYVRENQLYRAEQANRDTLVFFLSSGRGVCAGKPSSAHVPDAAVAGLLPADFERDQDLYGRAQKREGLFPRIVFRRYFTPVRGGRTAVFCGAVLRML